MVAGGHGPETPSCPFLENRQLKRGFSREHQLAGCMGNLRPTGLSMISEGNGVSASGRFEALTLEEGS
jgi:hypothetical protein